jgi:hypothetical protein
MVLYTSIFVSVDKAWKDKNSELKSRNTSPQLYKVFYIYVF